MQVDMHYCGTAVLARAAGFGEQDALDIGHAAQYVDDAQDGRDIVVGGRPFSPLSTANDLGRYLRSKEPDVWRKVYLPFHFLPPGRVSTPGDAFLTQPGGFLVDELLKDLRLEADSDRVYRLCRLGVALHAVADTWSHQGFSGRWHPENDVIDLEPLGVPESLQQALQQAARDWLGMINVATPMPVAHFQAGFLPDYPFLEWRAVFAGDGGPGRQMHLRNQEQYLEACRFIYQRLLDWPQDQPTQVTPWERIEPGIKRCLAHGGPNRQERCDKWREEFSWLFPVAGQLPDYLPHAWEVEALGKELRQTPFSDLAESLGSRPSYPGGADFAHSRWAMFHQAAARQRRWLGDYVSV